MTSPIFDPTHHLQSTRAGGPNADCHHLLKVLLCGDDNAGKTSLLYRYCYDAARPDTGLLGIMYKCKRLQINGQLVLLQLWPLAVPALRGPPAINPIFYHGAHGIVFAYDVTDEQALERVRLWLQEDERHAHLLHRDRFIARLLLATKVDRMPRAVSSAAGEALAAEFGIRHAESSSVTGVGVQEALDWISLNAEQRWKDAETGQTDLPSQRTSAVHLSPQAASNSDMEARSR